MCEFVELVVVVVVCEVDEVDCFYVVVGYVVCYYVGYCVVVLCYFECLGLCVFLWFDD